MRRADVKKDKHRRKTCSTSWVHERSPDEVTESGVERICVTWKHFCLNKVLLNRWVAHSDFVVLHSHWLCWVAKVSKHAVCQITTFENLWRAKLYQSSPKSFSTSYGPVPVIMPKFASLGTDVQQGLIYQYAKFRHVLTTYVRDICLQTFDLIDKCDWHTNRKQVCTYHVATVSKKNG